MPFVYAIAVLIVVIALARLGNDYLPMPGMVKAVMNVVAALMVIGIVLWAINTYVPMAGSIKAILNVVVFLATCVGVLKALNIWDSTVAFCRNLFHRASTEDTSGPTIHVAR